MKAKFTKMLNLGSGVLKTNNKYCVFAEVRDEEFRRYDT